MMPNVDTDELRGVAAALEDQGAKDAANIVRDAATELEEVWHSLVALQLTIKMEQKGNQSASEPAWGDPFGEEPAPVAYLMRQEMGPRYNPFTMPEFNRPAAGKAMIPTNGVHITEAHYPKGFYVAKYDAEGFTSTPRWFPTLDKAKAYATSIQRAV